MTEKSTSKEHEERELYQQIFKTYGPKTLFANYQLLREGITVSTGEDNIPYSLGIFDMVKISEVITPLDLQCDCDGFYEDRIDGTPIHGLNFSFILNVKEIMLTYYRDYFTSMRINVNRMKQQNLDIT